MSTELPKKRTASAFTKAPKSPKDVNSLTGKEYIDNIKLYKVYKKYKGVSICDKQIKETELVPEIFYRIKKPWIDLTASILKSIDFVEINENFIHIFKNQISDIKNQDLESKLYHRQLLEELSVIAETTFRNSLSYVLLFGVSSNGKAAADKRDAIAKINKSRKKY